MLQVTIPVFGTAGFEAAGLAAEGAGLVDDGAGLVGAEAALVTAGLGAALEAVAPVSGFLAAEGPVAGRLEAAADPGLDPATEEVAEDPGRLEAAADAAEGTPGLAATGLDVAGLAPAAARKKHKFQFCMKQRLTWMEGKQKTATEWNSLFPKSTSNCKV